MSQLTAKSRVKDSRRYQYTKPVPFGINIPASCGEYISLRIYLGDREWDVELDEHTARKLKESLDWALPSHIEMKAEAAAKAKKEQR